MWRVWQSSPYFTHQVKRQTRLSICTTFWKMAWALLMTSTSSCQMVMKTLKSSFSIFVSSLVAVFLIRPLILRPLKPSTALKKSKSWKRSTTQSGKNNTWKKSSATNQSLRTRPGWRRWPRKASGSSTLFNYAREYFKQAVWRLNTIERLKMPKWIWDDWNREKKTVLEKQTS